jgi:hypothetical protein
MPIRRKSTQQRTPKDCAYHEQVQHERSNQDEHNSRQREDDDHDPTSCWCCCDDCTDLDWYYTPRKGVWWQIGDSGEPRLMRETFDERRGFPVISPSSSRKLLPPPS